MKRSITALSVFALLASACSTRSSDEVGEPPAAVGNASSAVSESSAHVGDTLNLTRVDGTKIAVTLTQIINPATITNGTAEADKAYLAAKFTLVNRDKNPEQGDVNINVTVVGSDNQIYTADLHDVTECTNFESGEYHLGPDESTTGCVVFMLPHGVAPAKVKYTPSEGFADDFGEWLVS